MTPADIGTSTLYVRCRANSYTRVACCTGRARTSQSKQWVGWLPVADAQLTIVGNGPEKTRLKSEIARRNLGANITFMAWIPQEQFLHLYDTHDVFSFPVCMTAAGWVVLKSFCRGMPVTCSISGGLKRLLRRSPGHR